MSGERKVSRRKFLYGGVVAAAAAGAGYLALQELAPKPSPEPSVPRSTEDVESKLGFHTTEAKGEKRFIMVLADFPDVKRQYSEEEIREKAMVDLDQYLREASYSQLWINADMTGPYVLPNPVSHYRISPVNFDVDKSTVLNLVKDVANAADKDVDFSHYSYMSILLGATHVEYGMIGLCALPGMLLFHTNDAISTESGETISNAAVFCENAHRGTYVHDTLHMLGGVIDGRRLTPCLYDHELEAKYAGSPENWSKCLINMGYWDPLSSHVAYELTLPPPGLSSWTKMRLGWIDPSKIALVNPGQHVTLRLDPLENADSSTQVIKIPLTADTFYLIENRQKIGFDANLPSSGVLILYADDRVDECLRGKTPVEIMDANPSLPYLIDAAFDIGKKEVYVDVANHLAVRLQKKLDLSYEIRITTPQKV